jgi:hypothetical protein
MAVDEDLFPWSRFLPPDGVQQFSTELEQVLQLVDESGSDGGASLEVLDRLVARWQERACALCGPGEDTGASQSRPFAARSWADRA